MERFPPLGRRAGIVIVLLLVLIAAVARAEEPRVIFQDGLVTATFDAVAAPRALEAIRSATGVEIVVLRAIEQQTLTLTAEQVPFERFIQRVLDALELGGFALVYEHDGGASRVIIGDRGHSDGAAPASEPLTPSSVLFLVRSTDADSIGLGRPGQVIVVESAPIATVNASECSGVSGDYPVQNVTVIDGPTTHLTSIVVCMAQGLDPGKRLTPTYAPVDGDAPPPGARYTKFIATLP